MSDASGEPILDVEGIQTLLPHRPPFLLVDRVVEPSSRTGGSPP